MEKNYIKLIIFDIVLIILLLLTIFLPVKLNYYHVVLFLVVLIILFKVIFGTKANDCRFVRDMNYNFIIIFLSFFLIYYLLGIIVGFVKTENYFTLEGILNFVLPYILFITIKEYLRYQMINKIPKFRLNKILVCLLFILVDLILYVDTHTFKNNSSLFMFIIVNCFPAISSSIVCSYISDKVSYKSNIFWLLIFNLYGFVIPIVPDTGLYLGALIKFLFPFVILYSVYSYFRKRNRNIPIKEKKLSIKYLFIEIMLYLFGLTMIYFTSNLFRYSTIAIASGSMVPEFYRGDVLIIDKKFDISKLKEGQVIAYKYNSTMIVHRIKQIERVDGEYFIYTKGDANDFTDNYVIYENMVVGIAFHKIPYIGLPTIWISEL